MVRNLSLVVTASADCSAKVWNWLDGECVQTLSGSLGGEKMFFHFLRGLEADLVESFFFLGGGGFWAMFGLEVFRSCFCV